MNIIIELKKCCNHAFVVRPPDAADDHKDGSTAFLVRPPDAADDHKDPFEVFEAGFLHILALVKASGKLIVLDKLLMSLKEAGHLALISSQMVTMLGTCNTSTSPYR
ncbi:hypothetical protein LSAT2_011052 [Lamellibrachia satsuma]|nr:hypothetical protein LSAT2_011052 [Lamellibrachia satsuma]